MKQVMVIAPSDDMDRRWVAASRLTRELRWPRSGESEPGEHAYIVGRARIATYRSPSWKIPLEFFVDERLFPGPEIPQGYVMPGWVHGVELDRSRLCVVCRGQAVAPQWRWCRTHQLEAIKQVLG